MSTTLSICGYSSTENKEFQKHLKAVKFCIENELSFPIETSMFFKGKLDGDDLESIKRDCIMPYIENGIEIPIKMRGNQWEKTIMVNEIPSEVDKIIIKLS